MPAPPARSSIFPTGSLSPSTAKTLFADWYDYTVALLCASGSAADARTALGAAADSAVVKLFGTQTVAGVKTFSSSPVLPGNASTALQAVPKQQLDALLPAGAVAHFAMSSAPSGWLIADGSAVSRTAYAALFAAIGTTFGAGDGLMVFNLPDLRGEFIRGWSGAKAVDTGRVFGSAQSDAIINHSHSIPNVFSVGGTEPYNGGNGADFNMNNSGWTGVSGNSAAETRPRNIALLACIKY